MRRPVRKFAETIRIESSLANRLRSHRYFPVAVLVSVVLTACVLHVWQRVRVLDCVGDVARLRQENAALVDASTKLSAEIASLCTSERIEKYASDTLHLKPIGADRIFTLAAEDKETPDTDQFAELVRAIERVGRYMPVVSTSQATAADLKRIRFDEELQNGGGE
ncbi:MAG: hypothetical protein ABIE70_13405 [bacterium]